MTGIAFIAWIERMNFNATETAKALGISRYTVAQYKKEGAPKYIALACAALSYGLPPMGFNEELDYKG